ncbi:ADPPT transferase, partial [Polyodon spathula]|nr:ADPPT transferase [Polyodon spathula]
MESVRWAFRCGSWSPSCSEWLLAARCVQKEEKDRIGQFVFAKDAKSAMVISTGSLPVVLMFDVHKALKECFIKAIGTGIGFNLQRAEFHVAPSHIHVGHMYRETKMCLDGEEEGGWAFEECMLDSHHHVAVALGKPDGLSHNLDDGLLNPSPSQFITLSFDDLVASAIPMVEEEDHEYWVGFQSKQEAPGRQTSSS